MHPRHCERNEAIQLSAWFGHGLLRFARNDEGLGLLYLFAQHFKLQPLVFGFLQFLLR
jgi:hypothetical protein